MGLNIDANTYYRAHEVCKLLGISSARLTWHCNHRGLRSTKRGDDRYIKGEWLTSWLDGQDLQTPKAAKTGTV